jgi:hypothetical protein
MELGSPVSMSTGLWAGLLRDHSSILSMGKSIFSLLNAHISPYSVNTGALSLAVKQEADHSPTSSAKLRIHSAMPPLPHMRSWYAQG